MPVKAGHCACAQTHSHTHTRMCTHSHTHSPSGKSAHSCICLDTGTKPTQTQSSKPVKELFSVCSLHSLHFFFKQIFKQVNFVTVNMPHDDMFNKSMKLLLIHELSRSSSSATPIFLIKNLICSNILEICFFFYMYCLH